MMKTTPQSNSKSKRKAAQNKKKTGLTSDFDGFKLSSKSISKKSKSKCKKKAKKKISKFNDKK